MSRFIPQTDMIADEIIQCSYQARALVNLCESAAWNIQNGGGRPEDLSDSIGSALRLVMELLEPVHDALETHEGLKGDRQ
jgi:hypothetical protein